MDQQSENQFQTKEFPHYDIIFKYQNPGKMKNIKNIDTQILKCYITDIENDETIQLSFPRKWLSIDNLSIVNILKEILNILTDYIHSQYDEQNIEEIFQQSFQDSHNIQINYPTDTQFIEKIHKDIIIVDQNIINNHHPYCGICQEPLQINESVVKLPCQSDGKDKPHFFHTGQNQDICPGIKPWLKENNSCPVCRFQLPFQKNQKIDSDSESISESDSESESESEEFQITDYDENEQEEEQQQQQEKEEEFQITDISDNEEENMENPPNEDNIPQQEIEIDPIVQQLIHDRQDINESEIIIILSLVDRIYQRYQPCQNPQCDLTMCIEDRKKRKIDQQEEILMDEAIRMSLNQNANSYLDDELVKEQQQIFQQSEQDYIEQIIQMSVMDESIQKNQNIFDNLKDEQESNQSKDETTKDEQLLMQKEDKKIIPSQIAIDCANEYGGNPEDLCNFCGVDRCDHDVSKRNRLIPCESDGEWSEGEEEEEQQQEG